jgi:hypothetical protein
VKAIWPDLRWTFAACTPWAVRRQPPQRTFVQIFEKACQQIERASSDKAVVVVNMKNVLDHPLLRSTGAFPNSTVAQWAINAQIGEIFETIRERNEWPTAFGIDGIGFWLSVRTSALSASA